MAEIHILVESPNTKMEPETVGKLVQGNLKSKIREEAVDLHFLPKTATIPGL